MSETDYTPVNAEVARAPPLKPVSRVADKPPVSSFAEEFAAENPDPASVGMADVGWYHDNDKDIAGAVDAGWYHDNDKDIVGAVDAGWGRDNTSEPPPTIQIQESSDPFMRGLNEVIKRLAAIVMNFEKGAPKSSSTPRAPKAEGGGTTTRLLTPAQEEDLRQKVRANAGDATEIRFSTIRDWFPDMKLSNDDIGRAFAFSDEYAITNTGNKPALKYAKDQPRVFGKSHNTINAYREKKRATPDHMTEAEKAMGDVPPNEPAPKAPKATAAAPPPPAPEAPAYNPGSEDPPLELAPEDYAPLNEFDQYDGGYYD